MKIDMDKKQVEVMVAELQEDLGTSVYGARGILDKSNMESVGKKEYGDAAVMLERAEKIAGALNVLVTALALWR